MKRFVCAALALTLIGSTAAVADPYGRGNWGGGHSRQDRGDYRRGDNGAGLAIGLGVGLFALAAIAASQHDRGEGRYSDQGYNNYGSGYDGNSGYGQGYGNGYHNNYSYRQGYGNGYGQGYGNTYGNGYHHGGNDSDTYGGYGR
jgi:hypothetical protein